MNNLLWGVVMLPQLQHWSPWFPLVSTGLLGLILVQMILFGADFHLLPAPLTPYLEKQHLQYWYSVKNGRIYAKLANVILNTLPVVLAGGYSHYARSLICT